MKLSKKMVGLICGITAGVLVIGTGGAVAAGRIAENNSIGKQAAENFAFVHAGVSPEKVTLLKNKFEFDDGVFVYDVEFMANGFYYDYEVKAADGTIMTFDAKQTKESLAATAVNSYSSQDAGFDSTTGSSAGSGATNDNTSAENATDTMTSATPGNGNQDHQVPAQVKLTKEEALQIAIARSGVPSGNVTVTESKADTEHGIPVYEFEFYCNNGNGNNKYEYTINANDGSVMEENKEFAGAGNAYGANNGTGDKTKPAPQDGTGNQYGAQGGNAQAGAGVQNGNGAPNGAGALNGGGAQNGSGYAGVEQAKLAACTHAGVNSADCRFIKAKLDDDGEYEIEFICGNYKYEYDIDARTCAVRDAESELCDNYGYQNGNGYHGGHDDDDDDHDD